MAKEPEVITVEGVMEILGPCRRTIYHLKQTDPDFPKPFKPGKRLYWIRAEIIAYREKKQAQYAERHPVHTKGGEPSPETEQWKRNAARAREYARLLRISTRKPKGGG